MLPSFQRGGSIWRDLTRQNGFTGVARPATCRQLKKMSLLCFWSAKSGRKRESGLYGPRFTQFNNVL